MAVTVDDKQNFISVDGRTVRNSYGVFFTVGERVAHQDEDAPIAEILRFEPKKDENEVLVHTTEGWAHIDYLVKL